VSNIQKLRTTRVIIHTRSRFTFVYTLQKRPVNVRHMLFHVRLMTERFFTIRALKPRFHSAFEQQMSPERFLSEHPYVAVTTIVRAMKPTGSVVI